MRRLDRPAPLACTGALAIGRLAIGKARIKRLRVDEPVVGHLKADDLEIAENGGPMRILAPPAHLPARLGGPESGAPAPAA